MFSSRSSKDCQERNAELCLENSVVQPLLTDLYQITMVGISMLSFCILSLSDFIFFSRLQAYAYWKSGKINDVASFDLYFRKNPFKGEFTIFAGLTDCLKFLENFHYSETDISYLKTVLPSNVEQEFYDFLQQLTPREVTVAALAEGSVCFPRYFPCFFNWCLSLRLCLPQNPAHDNHGSADHRAAAGNHLPHPRQLLLAHHHQRCEVAVRRKIEIYKSVFALRFRIAAGKDIKLLEFGLRRAQGPDGGLSASRYAYIGLLPGCFRGSRNRCYQVMQAYPGSTVQ